MSIDESVVRDNVFFLNFLKNEVGLGQVLALGIQVDESVGYVS